ncbi:ABC transporter permease, partial [Anaerotruncus massiliensis (ex Liu et al. 2021)]|uniref:ABC transporter permease n=2 Tax=Oscillospiraceae TaxID=216572 RepID=UPI003AB777D1
MEKKTISTTFKRFLRHNAVLLCLALLIVYFSIRRPAFIAPDNIMTIIRQGACTGILAVGLAHVLIIGGIDLSIGAMVSLTSVIAGVFMVNHGWPVWLSSVLCILLTCLLGLISGTAIHLTFMPPLIATLGVMNIVQGLAYLANNGMPIYNIPESLRRVGQESLFGIPNPVIVWAIVLLIGWFTLMKTKLGRRIFAVGSNEEAARLSGINTYRVRAAAYGLCGAYAGIAGIVMTGRLNSGQTNAGGTLYIDALTACVVGGISMSGGEGRVPGIIVGIIIMAALSNGMVAVGLNSYWQLA